MPHYLLSGILPDNFDPSTLDESTIHGINALNDEMEAAGIRVVSGGLSALSEAKSLRAIERTATRRGNQGGMPSSHSIARNNRGVPRMADVPGGTGTTFGKANKRINATTAPSSRARMRSRTQTRSRC